MTGNIQLLIGGKREWKVRMGAVESTLEAFRKTRSEYLCACRWKVSWVPCDDLYHSKVNKIMLKAINLT